MCRAKLVRIGVYSYSCTWSHTASAKKEKRRMVHKVRAERMRSESKVKAKCQSVPSHVIRTSGKKGKVSIPVF